MDSRESPLRLSDSRCHRTVLAYCGDMRMEVDLRRGHMGLELGARNLRRECGAYMQGRIAAHHPGMLRCGVLLYEVNNLKDGRAL